MKKECVIEYQGIEERFITKRKALQRFDELAKMDIRVKLYMDGKVKERIPLIVDGVSVLDRYL